MNNDEHVLPEDDRDNHPTYFKAEEIRASMKVDLNTFSSVVYPEGHLADYSPLHCNIWQKMTEAVLRGKGYERYAVALPRGHAKTQLLKLLIVYTILFADLGFIAVICNTATLAQNLITDVMGMLGSDQVIALFGDYATDMTEDSKEKRVFKFLGRLIILKPLGAGSALRGLNIDNKRPELMLCDDMQSIEEARSPEVSKNLLQWFLGTLLKARSYNRCVVVYVGNMYPDLEIGERGSGVYACILRNLQRSSEWLSWITGAILSDGTALWEEVISLDTLLSDLAQDTSMGEAETFYAEVLNDPKAGAGKHLDPSKIPAYPYVETDLILGKYLVIDPSLGKKKSDAQIVGLFYVFDEKGPVLMELRNIQESAPELVKAVLLWAMEERIPLIVAEAVAYQETLVQWFVFMMDLLGIEGINVAPLNRTGNKVTAILRYFKALMNGSCIVHGKARPFIEAQALMYVPTSPNNTDDMLDVGAMGERVFLELTSLYSIIPEAEVLTTRIVEDSEKDDYDNPTGVNQFLHRRT